MKNTVFLNSAKINFDHKLDFTPLLKITSLIQYDNSEPGEILERVQDQNVIITKEMPLGKDLILNFPSSIKLICEAGTGFNNIDIAAASERGIRVCNVPGYSTEAVAQLTVTLILNLSSSLTQQHVMIKQKIFDNFISYLRVPLFEVHNKTLGVIGAGTIGQQVINIAQALGMNILVYSRTPKQWNNPNISFVSLQTLLQQSDFVTIHCPLTSDTRHLINADTLKLMKTSSFIINTSRGPIINEKHLIEALQKRQIAGAALDVQDPEPPELNNPLFAMDNVILTPHIGWKPIETRQRLISRLALNIESFTKGQAVNLVN